MYNRRKAIALLESASVQLMGIGGIDFPKEEYASLKGRDIIVTHRVSDEYDMYRQGDYIRVPWGHIYKCIYRMDIDGIKQSPHYDKLTSEQKKELSGYDKIAVLYLRRNQERHIDDNGIERIYKEVVNDYARYLDIRIDNVRLEIGEVPCYNNGKPAPSYIGRSAGTFVEARKCVIINPYPEIALKYHDTPEEYWTNKQKIAEFVYSICAHELAHAIDILGKVSRKEIDDCIRDAKEEGFTTAYLETYGDDVPDTEIYAECMASTLVNIRKSEGKVIRRLMSERR